MTTTTMRCIETTLVSGMMSIDSLIHIMPTWMVVFIFVCLVWAWLPDEIEIWI
jgi:hypothetical protein